jgi:hypothetical protein
MLVGAVGILLMMIYLAFPDRDEGNPKTMNSFTDIAEVASQEKKI